jgi:hypothetical protein
VSARVTADRLAGTCTATVRAQPFACENAPLFETDPAMDIERINQIGNSLADLSSRTEALRRYL